MTSIRNLERRLDGLESTATDDWKDRVRRGEVTVRIGDTTVPEDARILTESDDYCIHTGGEP